MDKPISELSETEIRLHLEQRTAKRKEELHRTRPEVVEVQLTPDGNWIVWGANEARTNPEIAKRGGYVVVHAIKFADGSIWNCATGWEA